MTNPSLVEDIFLAALERNAQDRPAYLDGACRDNPELRQHVERLLEAHPKAQQILEPPVPLTGDLASTYVPTGEQSGIVIAGRFKLLEQIGEGGMGSVWVADQTQPVRRKVALKLIKPGMDSKSVLARFEAERQALALMDHPNIAKVLDGGVTELGRPFFVMEYVKGVPLTKYCDDARLTVQERLDLFIPICQAIQHAHQKGIIHRDLKPSNILVCLYDGKPVPKVIDFGLAKAIHQPLTEHTLFTGHGVVMGTPLYMSPEQAELNNLDVDTRTDVYSLGVILYELLTGTTPLEKQRFKEVAWQEMLRLIKDEEPPRPSTRLSRTATASSAAAQRRMEPIKLTQLLRGDLDWIVMKSLEKDRNRRYDTATGFASDVQRYLDGEAVNAHPPSTAYRVRKFARKNWVLLTTASAFAGLLVVSAVVSGWLAYKALRAEAVAEEKRIEADANAKAVAEKSSLYQKEASAHLKARIDAEISARALQVDLDLVELKADRRVGLLQLARPYKQLLQGFKHPRFAGEHGEEIVYSHGEWDDEQGRLKALREFVTIAVLANGQDYAPLLSPITHEGSEIGIPKVSPDGRILLSVGEDKTTRLWDMQTGKPLAILRREGEHVVNAGISIDSKTIFTEDDTGRARFWDPDGKYRTQTERRENLYEPAVQPNRLVEDIFSSNRAIELHRSSCMQILRDRIVINRVAGRPRQDGSNAVDQVLAGPIELWDVNTGGHVATIDPQEDNFRLDSLDQGRWITLYVGEHGSHVRVYAAETGKHILSREAMSASIRLFCSPSGITVISVNGNAGSPVERWDTNNWQIQADSKLFRMPLTFSSRLLSDDLVATANGYKSDVFSIKTGTRVTQVEGYVDEVRYADPYLVDSAGAIWNYTTGRNLKPGLGQRFPIELTRFCPDGRFMWQRHSEDLIDARTQKMVHARYRDNLIGQRPEQWQYSPGQGWFGLKYRHDDLGGRSYYDELAILRLPNVDSMISIPSDLLEFWAQVAVCGQLSDDGRFTKWDEATWQRKRQELAAIPSPSADFPFPGYVATDELHWLRSEYNAAADEDKLRLASELLRRAEAANDQAEGVRWREVLRQKESLPEETKTK